MKIGFIGAGNIATAIGSYIEKDKNNLVAYDISKESLELFKNSTSIESSSLEDVLSSGVIFICIKPQVIEEFITANKDKFNKDAIVVSVAAGISIKNLLDRLDNTKIVRLMPNLNASIGKSTTALAHNNLSSEELKSIKELVSSFGSVYEIDENDFSTFTAISGSAPAYHFYFASSMLEEAKKSGMGEEQAKNIILETMNASAKFAMHSKDSLTTLIDKVSSPNGTTERAINSMDSNNVNSSIQEAVASCKDRAEELGK